MRVSSNAFRKFDGVPVPEGHLKIAQRFSVGFEAAQGQVPKGRLKLMAFSLASAVPSGQALGRRCLNFRKVLGLERVLKIGFLHVQGRPSFHAPQAANCRPSPVPVQPLWPNFS